MRFIKLLFPLLAIIFCGSFSLASSLTLPKPKGIYGVGIMNVEFFDPSRTQLRSNEKRRWMVTLFYPTAKNNKTAPYMPGTLENGDVCGTKVFGHAIPHATLINDHTFPFIISCPGRGNVRQQNTILYEALASHGYIVMAIDQPYVANFVKFLNEERVTLTFKDAWNLPRDRDYRYQYDDEIIASAIQDIDFVLDNFSAFSELSLAIDKTRIILMGHSIGANIAHIKGLSDKRIQAIVDIDSKITDRAVFECLGVPPNPDKKPILFIRGMLQYQEDIGNTLTLIPNGTIWSPNVQHSAFSDDAYFRHKIKHYGMSFWGSFYNWLFKKGPYFSPIDTNLGDYNVDEWFEKYPEYIVKWLSKNIKKGS